MEAESKQIGLVAYSISSGSGNAEPERNTSVNRRDDKELDRSLQQIRKESELGTSDSASLKDDYSVLDHSVEAKNEPSNDQPGLLEKENGQTIKSVVCLNHDKGCEWEGKVEDQAEHLNKFPSSEDEDEVEGCGFQTVECECKEPVVFNQKSAHSREHRNHQEVACEFGYAGCDFRGPRYQMPKHLEASVPQHVSLLNAFMKRGKGKVESLETSRIKLYAHYWVFLFVVIILLVALVEYKIKVQELQSELVRFRHDLKREEAHLFMSWAIRSSHLYDLRANDEEHTRQLTVLQEHWESLDLAQNEEQEHLTEQRRLLKDLDIRVDLLQLDVRIDLIERVLKVKNRTVKLERRLESHMTDFSDNISELRKTQRRKHNQLKRNLDELEENIKKNVTKKELHMKKRIEHLTTEFNSHVRDVRRLESHMTDISDNISELGKTQRRKHNQLKRNLNELEENIKKNVTKKELHMNKRIKHLKTEFNSHVRDVEREILRLQEFQHHAKKTLHDLTFDVKELKSGFSKKYIDDTIRTLMCKLLPKGLGGC